MEKPEKYVWMYVWMSNSNVKIILPLMNKVLTSVFQELRFIIKGVIGTLQVYAYYVYKKLKEKLLSKMFVYIITWGQWKSNYHIKNTNWWYSTPTVCQNNETYYKYITTTNLLYPGPKIISIASYLE